MDRLAELVRSRFRGIQIIRIGGSTNSDLKNADLNLVNETSLPEVTSLIKNSVLHIDHEGGLVHIAACLGTHCCVLFGPTSPTYFGYSENINVGPATCGDCYWINRTWMNSCPRGLAVPACLDQLPPETVLAAIEPYLRSRNNVSSMHAR
jgi:ADP-heptose:LPS heptosyltransferase